jgi:hypothetical protein
MNKPGRYAAALIVIVIVARHAIITMQKLA